MMDFINSPDNDSNTAQRWYTTAVRTAFVAGALALIVAVLLLANAYRMKVTDIRDENALAELKLQATRRGADEGLVEKIRQADLRNRRNRFRHLELSHRGSRLLLGSLVVFFAAVKWAHTLKKKLPHPRLTPGQEEVQMRQAVLARRAVFVAIVGFCLVSLAVALKREIKHAPDKASSRYPTMEEVYRNWPAFRGPEGSGVSAYANIPDKWDAESGQGILWKTPVPLEGHNSPVLWGDRIFLTGADAKTYVYKVYCFDANSGKLLWTGDVPNAVGADGEPLEVMEDTGLAACTGVTDGRRVYVIFATGNVAAFDYDGNRVWLRKLGVPDSVYGYASSLAIFQDKVIVQFDQATADDGLSRVIALDSFTGRTVWETKRPVGNSWSSPIVAKVQDNWRLFTAADPWVIAYDPATGTEIWRADCVMGDVAPSPIYANGFVFAVEPYSRLVAIRTGGKGNVTETHIAWFAEDDIPDICSPVSNGELVWILTTDGLLTCYKVADGKKLWDHEFERTTFNASPGLVGDKLYLLTVKGVVYIIEAGDEFREITTCRVGGKCYASPVFGDGRIYIRTTQNLFCIGNTE